MAPEIGPKRFGSFEKQTSGSTNLGIRLTLWSPNLAKDIHEIARLHDDVTRAKSYGSCSEIRGLFE